MTTKLETIKSKIVNVQTCYILVAITNSLSLALTQPVSLPIPSVFTGSTQMSQATFKQRYSTFLSKVTALKISDGAGLPSASDIWESAVQRQALAQSGSYSDSELDALVSIVDADDIFTIKDSSVNANIPTKVLNAYKLLHLVLASPVTNPVYSATINGFPIISIQLMLIIDFLV